MCYSYIQEKKMRLGVYVGSFNPPHKGHHKVINYLINNNFVDKVIIVPTLNYWNKKILVSLNDRINMLKYWEDDSIIIDTKHNEYKYTYQLLRALQKDNPLDQLYLIMGADNIVEFDKWKNYQELLKYKIIVMNRNNIDINKYLKKYNSSNFIVIQDYHFIDISSSIIRDDLNSQYLDREILDYIQKKQLY